MGLIVELWDDLTDQRPDRIEKGIRFGCGGIFGLFAGLYVSLRLWRLDSIIPAIVVIIIAIFLCGYLSMRQGDSFWDRFL